MRLNLANALLIFWGANFAYFYNSHWWASYDGVTVKAFDWLSKGRRFEPHLRRFFLQPQWNPYPTLTPPSCWVRHVRSIGGRQYGLAVCCVVSACDSTDSREISNDGNPSHPHLFTSFQHSSLDGAQAGPIKPFGTPSTNFYTQHTNLWSPGQLMV